jgi:uroporphyrinogen-III decarboxylase
MGRTMKLVKGVATTPLPMDYPVHDMDSWLRLKHHYMFNENRVDRVQAERSAELRKQGVLTQLWVPGAFWTIRDLMGDEALCYAFYDQPELLLDILKTFTETSLEVIRRISRYVKIDNLCIGEDLAGKSGPLLSPEHVREYFMPYYNAVWDAAREAEAALFSQDSDGYIEPVMEAFIECGVNVFYPCEPAAGMDIVKLRERFGKRCAFKGGIDKMALLGSKDDIDCELRYKLTNTSLHSGVVFGLDHRIPNGISIENYRYYINRARELLGLPEIIPAKHTRMAF